MSVENDMGGMTTRIENCARTLDNWNRTTFGNLPRAIRDKQQQLVQL